MQGALCRRSAGGGGRSLPVGVVAMRSLAAPEAAASYRAVKSRVQSWWRGAGWDEFVRLLGGVAFGGGVLFFVALAVSAPKGAYVTLELQLMHAMRHGAAPAGPAWLASAVRDLTALGSAAVLLLLTGLILGFLCLRRKYRVVALLAGATVGGQILNTVLKNAFERVRPEAALRLVEVTSTSFPSGHAMAASIFYLTVGLVLARMAPRRREKIYFVATALLLTGVVGCSRVYLGVHYPTDVLAGWAAGGSWALLCCYVADRLARRGALRAEMTEHAE